MVMLSVTGISVKTNINSINTITRSLATSSRNDMTYRGQEVTAQDLLVGLYVYAKLDLRQPLQLCQHLTYIE